MTTSDSTTTHTVTSTDDPLIQFQTRLIKASEKAADGELRRMETRIGKLLNRFEWLGIELGGELDRYKAMLGAVRGCRGRWSEFLRSVGLAESTARTLMHCHRQFGDPETIALLKKSGTLPTTIMKLSPPSVPQAARDELLTLAESQPVTPKEADELIAKHTTRTLTVKPQAESVAIEGLGRVVLHPTSDADQRIVEALKRALTKWATERQMAGSSEEESTTTSE